MIVAREVTEKEDFYADPFERSKVLKLIQSLVKFGASVNSVDQNGRSMLWLVAEENEVDVLEALIKTPRLPRKDIKQDYELLPDLNHFVELFFDEVTHSPSFSASFSPGSSPEITRLWFWRHIAVEKESTEMIARLMNCLLQKVSN